jgi:hypothetical protein
MMLSLLLSLALVAAEEEAPPRPLLVILVPQVDARAKGNDTQGLAGMLQSEFSSAARGADVLLLEDAAAHAAVTDPAVLRCVDVTCAQKVGAAVKARYVVATQVSTVGKQRVVTVRLFDADQSRLLGMQTEKVGFDEESLPPVVARASLRLATAGHVDKVPEPPKKVEPVPEPEPAPAPAPAPVVRPKKEEPQTIIVVPPPVTPTPAPVPQPLDTPPSPIAGGNIQAHSGDQVPDPNRLPAGAPTAPVEQGRKIGWGPRAGVIVAAVLLAVPAPFGVVAAIGGSVYFILRAVDVSHQLKDRPHDSATIKSLVGTGRAYEGGGYTLIGVAVGLVVYMVAMVTGGTILAILLP